MAVGIVAMAGETPAEYDVIHACDFDTILPAILIKSLYGKRLVYDIFDFYADHLRATPMIIKMIIRRVDLWAIGRADGRHNRNWHRRGRKGETWLCLRLWCDNGVASKKLSH